MTWFRSDDGFYRHGKVRRLGPDKVPAVGVWHLAGTWAAENLTDGFVPFEIVKDWDPDGRLTERLIEVGLWEKGHVDGEDGVVFHDFLDYNPSKAQVLEARRKDAEKKARMRAALAEKRRSARPKGTPSGSPRTSPALPDPGSLPSSGTPAAGGPGPVGPPPAMQPARSAVARQKSAEIRELLNRRRPATPAPSRRRRGDVVRQRQDELAELDAVQATPDPPPHPPPETDRRPDGDHPGTTQLPDQRTDVA